ncbi:hypothetical protein OROGR_015856 [Orobanche gracilis]
MNRTTKNLNPFHKQNPAKQGINKNKSYETPKSIPTDNARRLEPGTGNTDSEAVRTAEHRADWALAPPRGVQWADADGDVASEIKSSLDELKSELEKESKASSSHSKSSKEYETLLKNEIAKFQEVYDNLCKEKAGHLLAIQSFSPWLDSIYRSTKIATEYKYLTHEAKGSLIRIYQSKTWNSDRKQKNRLSIEELEPHLKCNAKCCSPCIEMNASAVADTQRNAEIDHISNCRFVAGKVACLILIFFAWLRM